MSLDEKKAAACLTLYIFVLSQMIFAIMVKILTRGYNAGKKKTNLKNRRVLQIQSKSKENRRQSKRILQVNALAGIQAPARCKLLGMIKWLLT